MTLEMYLRLLEAISQQVFELAAHHAPASQGTNLTRWKNSVRVLGVLENTIKDCHLLCNGGKAMACLMSRSDGPSSLVQRADTVKYIRQMGQGKPPSLCA